MDIQPVVDHQHIHLFEHPFEEVLRSSLPADLANGHGHAVPIHQGEIVLAGGQGDQVGPAAVPAEEQLPPQRAVASRDRHHRGWHGRLLRTR